jgi:hypothetical protein
VLEVRNMDEPVEMRYLNEECPNLERLRVMLCGVMDSKGTLSSGGVKPSQVCCGLEHRVLTDKTVFWESG